jgi:protein-disulfide isomerase
MRADRINRYPAAPTAATGTGPTKFWTYFALLYGHQDAENSGAFMPASLEARARDASLNVGAFRACLRSEQSLAGIRAGTLAAGQREVTVTPTFFIDGGKVIGVLTFAQMVPLIDAALAGTK